MQDDVYGSRLINDADLRLAVEREAVNLGLFFKRFYGDAFYGGQVEIADARERRRVQLIMGRGARYSA